MLLIMCQNSIMPNPNNVRSLIRMAFLSMESAMIIECSPIFDNESVKTNNIVLMVIPNKANDLFL